MRNLTSLIIYFALIAVIVYGYIQLQKYESLSTTLLEKNHKLESKKSYGELQKRMDDLEAENKLLKDQINQLENHKFLFNATQDEEEKYKLEENLKFKDETKKLKKELEESSELKDDEGYKIKPSIEFDQEKRSIDGVKLEVETKF